MGPTDQPYMGTAEVAEYLGITPQAVSNWLSRDAIVPPLVRLCMGPIWNTQDIVDFKERRDLLRAAQREMKVRASELRDLRKGLRQG